MRTTSSSFCLSTMPLVLAISSWRAFREKSRLTSKRFKSSLISAINFNTSSKDPLFKLRYHTFPAMLRLSPLVTLFLQEIDIPKNYVDTFHMGVMLETNAIHHDSNMSQRYKSAALQMIINQMRIIICHKFQATRNNNLKPIATQCAE